MGNINSAAIAIFALTMLFLAFMNIFAVLIVDEKLDQVDEFITRKVSVHRGFTPQVESELSSLLESLNLNLNDFDFTGTTMSPVPWGNTVHVVYEFKGNVVQRGLEFLGIPQMEVHARDFLVVATGR